MSESIYEFLWYVNNIMLALLQGVAGDTSTPECSLVGVYKETDRKQLDAVFLYRYNQIASAHFFGIRTGIFHLEHLRH